MEGLIESDKLSNEQYHATEGFYSSSQFKTANEDMELFHKKYITKEVIDNKKIAAFDIGTYYHTAILEPKKLKEECAIYTGKVRRGKDWDAFSEEHKGKAIITQKEYLQAENLIEATKGSPLSMELLGVGKPELSLFVELEGVKVKVRADWINIEDGYILDLKSTTGNAKDEHKIKTKITSFNYDLSAALYLDAFNAYLGPKGLPLLDKFYWTFASKDFCNCRTYVADESMMDLGRKKYKKALGLIRKYQENGWTFYDEIIEISPLPWEVQLWESEGSNLKGVKQNNRKSLDEDLL